MISCLGLWEINTMASPVQNGPFKVLKSTLEEFIYDIETLLGRKQY